ISRPIVITIVKEKTSWINIPVCLQSERSLIKASFLMTTKQMSYQFLPLTLVRYLSKYSVK
ncbi:hypothetical protein, partial [Streptococcus agalactiae]|uniref:hypothetical protein n=1 Tax=Streptococcus agalactiae TaxID=1311 RepID=UPI0013FCF53A